MAYWSLMTGCPNLLALLTNCDKILNNVIWIHLGADAGRRAGYKNFSILCLRQDVQTDAVTHEILNTFNVDKDKYKYKYKDKDKKLFNIVSLPGFVDICGDT